MSKTSFTKDEVYLISERYFREAYDARKRDKDGIWVENIRLLNNQYDFDDRAGWQSKNWIPSVSTTTEYAKAKFMGALVKSPDFFSIDGKDDESKLYVRPITKMVKYWLQENKFYEVLSDLILSGIIARITAKQYWKNEIVRDVIFTKDGEQFTWTKRGRWVFEAIDPFRIWNDPWGLSRYTIHEYKIDYAVLLEIAKNPKNGYDYEAVKELAAVPYNEREYTEWVNKQQGYPPASPRKIVQCLEFMGDLISLDGTKIERKKMWTIANETTVIRMPIDTPAWNPDNIFIQSEVKRKFFQIYHAGLIEDVAGLARFYTDMFNLAADCTNFSGLRAFEVDIGSLEYPEQIKESITPGMCLWVNRQQGSGKVVEPMTLGTVPGDVMGMLRYVDGEIQTGTAITEFGMASGPSSGRPTAREGVMKEAASNFMFNSIARILEDTVIVQTIQGCIENILQYEYDFDMPEVMAYLGQEDAALMQELTSEKRYSLTKGRFRIKARGMSIELTRMHELQKTMDYIETLGKISQAEAMLQRWNVDIPLLIKNVTENFGYRDAEFMEAALRGEVAPALPPPPEPEQPPQGMGAPPPGMMPPGMMPPPQGGGQPNLPGSPEQGVISGMLPPLGR